MVEKMGWHDELRRPMMLIITAVKSKARNEQVKMDNFSSGHSRFVD